MQASYTTEAQTRHAALEAFRTFATDADFLNRHQLKAAWVAVFGSRPHKVLVDKLTGGNQSGVTFEAFCQAVLDAESLQEPEARLRAIFKAFDLRCVGYISRQDAMRVFKSAAPAVHERVVDEVFNEIDTDHDGRVAAHEFVSMLRGRVA